MSVVIPRRATVEWELWVYPPSDPSPTRRTLAAGADQLELDEAGNQVTEYSRVVSVEFVPETNGLLINYLIDPDGPLAVIYLEPGSFSHWSAKVTRSPQVIS